MGHKEKNYEDWAECKLTPLCPFVCFESSWWAL